MLQQIVNYLDTNAYLAIELTNTAFTLIALNYWKQLCAERLKEDIAFLGGKCMLDLKQMYNHHPLPTHLVKHSGDYSVLKIEADGLSFLKDDIKEDILLGNIPYNTQYRRIARYIYLKNGDKIERKVFKSSVMYFEVEIEEHTKKRGWRDLLPKKEKGYIGIGLVVDTYPYGGGMPGWSRYSYGYHSTGRAYERARTIEQVEKFGVGDVVGCGFNLVDMKIFYTLNGQLIYMTTVNEIYLKPYPAIASGVIANVRVNFGHRPFLFNLETLE